ncbi:MAG TPA: trimeric intracellular cation channel family protein [Hyphomonadaceae bacterium]|nr:trimeric intracellular cation channel family protein [Hyphomonadaceae bacterium]
MQFTLLSVLDYAGVAMFAASGALMAAQKRQDVVAFIFFAAITGVGGGTLRDLLIDAPVFWVLDPGYVIVCTVVAVLVFLTRGRGIHEQGLLWLDAVGLCVYAVVGAAKALSLGVHPVICVVMGALTATFGGIIRDVLAGEPSILLRRELYITPATISASTFIVLRILGVDWAWASAIAVVGGFIVRAGAIQWKWHMAAFEPPKAKDR